MSWIKDNKFVVGLTGGTLVGVVLLYVVGSKGQAGYEASKADYQSASAEVEGYGRMSLSPKPENRDSKKKALDEYRQDLESLQSSFDAYRPKELKNVSPQDFTNHLKAVNDELRAAFKESGIKLPDQFFCGFEGYKSSIANGKATGILEYQLAGIKELMLALAKSRASELKNLHRPPLIEETGGDYTAQDKDVARPLSLEIAFVAPEKSAREFLSAVTRMDGKFAVIRTIRITNIRKDPPRAADAKFDSPSERRSDGAVDDLFSSGFVLPDESAKPGSMPATKPKAAGAAGAAPPAVVEAAPAPPSPPKATDSGRVLSQVLGNEEVQVFIRLDFMLFLPTRKLP